ncbi:MAG: zf-HC2 domain-containing protein [Planctomycetes bacterium]|nr:zf-HC2 domain-containing protein [Planctomycetota bacterium]
MNCREAGELLAALASGELEDHESEEVLAHVEKCPRCSRKLGEYREALVALREAAADVPVAGKAFGRALSRRLDEVDVRRGRKVQPVVRWQFMGGVAAAAAAVFIVATVLLPHIGSPDDQQPAVAQPATAPYPVNAYLVFDGSSPYYRPVAFQQKGDNSLVLRQPGVFHGIPAARLVWRDDVVGRADYQLLESRVAELEARLRSIDKAQIPAQTKSP